MNHAITGAVVILILIVLFVISTLFDLWIDQRGKKDRYDGDTAIWVAYGTLYVVILWAAMFAMLTDVRTAVTGAVALLACFVAAGWPMYRGEADRSRRARQRKHQ